MQTFDMYRDIPAAFEGAVVVIGNFDGVHKGHQVLLDRAKTLAAEHNTIVSVLTFEPHPRRLLRPDDPPFRITPPVLKAVRLEKGGVDCLVSLNFDWDFASQTAEQFVQDILIDGLKPVHIVVGYDFRFGQLRAGCPDTIKAAGLPITVVEEVTDEGDSAFSSSRIRQYLRRGKIAQANEVLGWDWEIRGEVVKGDQRGRELGYPTANFTMGETVHPAYGVYAARVQVEGDDKWHGAAINIGIRPMFEIPEAQVESYIFDFDQEIYGKILRVRPVQFLRGEAKFDSLDELIKQIGADCVQAREILSV